VTGAEPEPAHLLALAIAVACEAGEMLADRRGRAAVVGTKSSPTDVVTEMDQAAERLIRPGERRRSAGLSTRWTAPSTTCTDCLTGQSASPPRPAGRWLPE
jgi:hypothetical protein